ncbi:hypothetical protein GCM10009600_23440 [Oerskovia paurometabola]
MSRPGPPSSLDDSGLPARADVVVVGAGILGAAVAHYLAQRGASVLVLEQGAQAGSGATGRSGGMVRAYDPDPSVADLALRSLATYRNPDEWARGAAPLHVVGAVTIADPGRDQELEAAAGQINSALGTAAHVVVGSGEAAGIGLAGGVALVEPDAGWVQPSQVTEDWLHQAVGNRARVRYGVRVLAIEEHRARPRVLTDAGTVVAGAVVAAVGAWAAHPVPGMRPGAAVRSRSIQVSIVDRLQPTQPHATFVDLRNGTYAKPIGSEQTLIGLPHLVWDSPFDAPPDPVHEQHTLRALAAHLPWLGSTVHHRTVRASDAFDLQSAADRGPELLSETDTRHVWSVRGGNGVGVRVAPEAGRRIADVVVADLLPGVA